MAPIKILNCLHRSDFGGAHWRVVWVAKRLEDMGVATEVLYPDDSSKHYEAFLIKQGINYKRVGIPVLRKKKSSWLPFLLSMPWTIFKMVRLINNYGTDIIHANGVTNLQPVLAGIVTGTPVLWHWNDMLTPTSFVSLVKRLAKFKLVQIAVATPAITEYYGLQSYAPEVISAPIGRRESMDDHSQENLRKLLSLNDEARLIGFVGHLVAAKGVEEFVDVAVRLLGDYPDMHAVMIGGILPNHKAFYSLLKDKINQSGCGKRIHLIGYRDDVPALVRQLDLFIFSSRSEACPITVLEVMREGVPLVATMVGDVPRMLHETGCPLVEVGDTEALYASALRMLEVSQNEKRDIADKVSLSVERYSIEKVSEMHLEIYQKLLDSSNL